MTKEETIKDWFIHQFWPIYPGKWCRAGKGSRQEALNSMLKYNPDEEERTRILGNLKAQIRADKGNSNRKWWVIGKTYVNQKIWEDTIEIEEVSTRDTKFCQCGQETIGPKYRTCPKCSETKEEKLELTRILNSLGLYSPGQSLSELSQNCREYMLKSGKSGKLLNKMTSSLKPAGSGNQ